MPKSINYKNYTIDVAGTIHGDHMIELNDTVSDDTSQAIHNNCIMESNKEIIGKNSGNTISIYQQRYVENQSRYRSRQKNFPRLNNNNTMSVNNVTEYYISHECVLYSL